MLFMILNGVFSYTRYLKKQNIGYKKDNYQTWGKGAGAELIVEHELDKLPAEYKAISDFNTGHGNIDHIVIGPKGIFTIETKASTGYIQYDNNSLKINGTIPQKDYLSQTHAEVIYLNKLLLSKFNQNFPITGILEFPHGKVDTNTIHGKIDGIWVGGNNFHQYALNKSSYNLSPQEIDDIYKYLQELKISNSETSPSF